MCFTLSAEKEPGKTSICAQCKYVSIDIWIEQTYCEPGEDIILCITCANKVCKQMKWSFTFNEHGDRVNYIEVTKSLTQEALQIKTLWDFFEQRKESPISVKAFGLDLVIKLNKRSSNISIFDEQSEHFTSMEIPVKTLEQLLVPIREDKQNDVIICLPIENGKDTLKLPDHLIQWIAQEEQEMGGVEEKLRDAQNACGVPVGHGYFRTHGNKPEEKKAYEDICKDLSACYKYRYFQAPLKQPIKIEVPECPLLSDMTWYLMHESYFESDIVDLWTVIKLK
jgi:hypothetical protein